MFAFRTKVVDFVSPQRLLGSLCFSVSARNSNDNVRNLPSSSNDNIVQSYRRSPSASDS